MKICVPHKINCHAAEKENLQYVIKIQTQLLDWTFLNKWDSLGLKLLFVGAKKAGWVLSLGMSPTP